MPERPAAESNRGCVPANSQSANNLQSRGNRHEPGRLHRHARLGALGDQRRLERADPAELPEHGSGWRVHAVPDRLGGSGARPLQDTSFSPAYDKDKFENTAWTVNGKIGDLKLVYTGGYLVRNIDQTKDYTNYARSNGGSYYSCTGGGANGTGFGNKVPTPVVCYSPVTSWHDTVRNTHQSHEIRLSTPDDWRARGILGAYWEDFEIQDDMNFLYKTFPSCTPSNLATALAGGAPCVANVITAPGTTAMNPGERNDNTAFGEDAQRGYQQTAVFVSVDFDMIPKVLTLDGGHALVPLHGLRGRVGVRHRYVASLMCPMGQSSTAININAENLHSTYTGFKSRGNLTWHITPDVMVYYTFSQGFRPGGFNRSQRPRGPDIEWRRRRSTRSRRATHPTS